MDKEFNNCVLYIPYPASNRTVVAIIAMDPKILGLITVKSVVIFNKNTRTGIEGPKGTKVVMPTKESFKDIIANINRKFNEHQQKH